MSQNRFVPGQRWLSQTEPELGLGLVINADSETVSIIFPSVETTRVYTVEGPPLTRVRFSVGDTLKTQDGKSFIVEEVTDNGGLVVYFSRGKKIDESKLSDSLTFSKPIDRLLNGQVDDKGIYNLRHRALYRRFKTYRSPLRGLLGGRYFPAGHQLYTAVQATRVMHPRVLLSDEPGLGRTVEAGLILQRLWLSGQANRVLLVGPEDTLEWTETELQRRFGFEFERLAESKLAAAVAKKAAKPAKSAKKGEEAPNPLGKFAPWLSLSLEGLKGKTAHLVAEGQWDVFIVSGAEHIEWSEAKTHQLYNGVEEIAEKSKSLILISAKGPELDSEQYLGLVRLLDPEEFGTVRRHNKRRKDIELLTHAVEVMAAAEDCDKDVEAALKPLGAEDPKVKELLKPWRESREGAKDFLIEYLVDSQQCGRQIFHNTRATCGRLPVREFEWVRLEPKTDVRAELREEYKIHGKGFERGGKKSIPSAIDSAITAWLGNIIAPIIPEPELPLPKGAEPPLPPPPPPRALIVCMCRGRAIAAAKALSKRVPDKICLVTHEAREGLPQDFAAIVVGLEDAVGRGFSGVDFVVFWDPPQTLTEARLAAGLLDFSGIAAVSTKIPYVEDTPFEKVGRWIQEGLGAFDTYTPAQAETEAEFAKAAHDIAKRIGVRHNPALDAELKALIKKSQAAHEALLKKIDKQRDTFLEAVSCRPTYSERDLNRMTSSDEDTSLDAFVFRVMEQLGMTVEGRPQRTCFVKWNPEATQRLDDIPKEGMLLTYSREAAMANETAHFLTWDHPLVAKATERLLSTAIGNTAYVVWEDERAQLVLLEGIYVAEPQNGDASLQLWRFMPPTPIRVVVSHELEDLSSQYTTELVNKNVRNGRREWLRNNARPLHNLVPSMMRNLQQRAEIKMQELAAKASYQMEAILTNEINRQKRLPETTRRKAEIKRIEEQIAALKQILTAPTLRLDSLRLIRRGPSGKGI